VKVVSTTKETNPDAHTLERMRIPEPVTREHKERREPFVEEIMAAFSMHCKQCIRASQTAQAVTSKAADVC